MNHLNWGYIQLGLVALVFGGLQVWWISSVFWRRNLAKPQSGGEFRKSLWASPVFVDSCLSSFLVDHTVF